MRRISAKCCVFIHGHICNRSILLFQQNEREEVNIWEERNSFCFAVSFASLDAQTFCLLSELAWFVSFH